MADKQQILDLETRFWRSMKEKDVATAQSLIASECLITGAHGAMRIDPAKSAAMTRDGQWSLDEFTFSDVEVIAPGIDVAVIAYRVHQTGTMNNQPMNLHAADSTTWVREGGAWKVAGHSETILTPQRETDTA